jgi:hypothetical protein
VLRWQQRRLTWRRGRVCTLWALWQKTAVPMPVGWSAEQVWGRQPTRWFFFRCWRKLSECWFESGETSHNHRFCRFAGNNNMEVPPRPPFSPPLRSSQRCCPLIERKAPLHQPIEAPEATKVSRHSRRHRYYDSAWSLRFCLVIGVVRNSGFHQKCAQRGVYQNWA